MMEKLVIDRVPSQAINFVKQFCKLTGQNEEEYWRREVASSVNCLVDTLAEHKPNHIRQAWELNEAVKSLETPRGPELRKIDEEVWRLHEREKSGKKQ